MRVFVVALACALLGTVLPSEAAAHRPDRWIGETDETHGFDLSFLATVRPSAAGGAIVMGIPVAPRGVTRHINDALYIDLEFQADGWPGRDAATAFLGGPRYQVFLFDWFAPYVFTRAGVRVSWPRPLPSKGPNPGFALAGGVGASFTIGRVFGFRVEGGYPGAWAGIQLRF